jgi:hypothetical protein
LVVILIVPMCLVSPESESASTESGGVVVVGQAAECAWLDVRRGVRASDAT